MTRILFLFLITSLSACSQSLTPSDVNKLIDIKITQNNKTLDSVIVKSVSTSNGNTLPIDTLNLGTLTSAYYTLCLTATNKSNGEIASGEKRILIRKSGTQTRLIRDYTVVPFGGDSSVNNASWIVQYVNGIVVVKVNGLFNKNISWSLAKQSQF